LVTPLIRELCGIRNDGVEYMPVMNLIAAKFPHRIIELPQFAGERQITQSGLLQHLAHCSHGRRFTPVDGSGDHLNARGRKPRLLEDQQLAAPCHVHENFGLYRQAEPGRRNRRPGPTLATTIDGSPQAIPAFRQPCREAPERAPLTYEPSSRRQVPWDRRPSTPDVASRQPATRSRIHPSAYIYYII
jgi:hypothetical protein